MTTMMIIRIIGLIIMTVMIQMGINIRTIVIIKIRILQTMILVMEQ